MIGALMIRKGSAGGGGGRYSIACSYKGPLGSTKCTRALFVQLPMGTKG